MVIFTVVLSCMCSTTAYTDPACYYIYLRMLLPLLMQEARLSQEQLADQVVKASEERHGLLAQLDNAKKVWTLVIYEVCETIILFDT